MGGLGVSRNWGSIWWVRALYYLGSALGPLIVGNSHMPERPANVDLGCSVTPGEQNTDLLGLQPSRSR